VVLPCRLLFPHFLLFQCQYHPVSSALSHLAANKGFEDNNAWTPALRHQHLGAPAFTSGATGTISQPSTTTLSKLICRRGRRTLHAETHFLSAAVVVVCRGKLDGVVVDFVLFWIVIKCFDLRHTERNTQRVVIIISVSALGSREASERSYSLLSPTLASSPKPPNCKTMRPNGYALLLVYIQIRLLQIHPSPPANKTIRMKFKKKLFYSRCSTHTHFYSSNIFRHQ
jgi:hypothetical protein